MMCNLSQGVLEDGIRIGRVEGRAEERKTQNLKSIQAIAKNIGVSYEKAMDLLEITDQAERQRYLDQLTH